MRIVKAEIYGYGKIIQQSLVFHQGLTAVYGLNEAGKTTWMDFIRHVLFGFPTKKGSERQYLPKIGGVCGGCLYIDTEKYGQVRIERVLTAQRVTGEARVFLSSGEEKAEMFISELLDGMTEQIFQNVFHFGLEGIEEMHQKKGEDISDFLFATAVFGEKTGRAFMENKEKEMKLLFKMRGKSKIDQSLEALEQAHSHLRDWKKKEQNYEDLLERRSDLQHQSQEKKLEIKRNQAEIEKTKQLLTIRPTAKAYQLVKANTAMLGKESFIAADVRAYLKEKLVEKDDLQREIRKLSDQLDQIEYQMQNAQSDYAFHLHELPFKEDVAYMEKMEHMLTSCEDRLKENERKLQSLYQHLGANVDRKLLEVLPDQFFMREQLKEQVHKYEMLTQVLSQREAEIVAMEREMQEKQIQIKRLRQSFGDLLELKRGLEKCQQVEEWHRNLENLQAQRAGQRHVADSFETASKRKKKKQSSGWVMSFLWMGFLLLVGILIVGAAQGNWLVVALVICAALVFLVSAFQRKTVGNTQQIDDYLDIQIKGLEIQLAGVENQALGSSFEWMEKITKEEERRAELLAEQKAFEILKQKLQRLQQELEQTMQEQNKVKSEVQGLLQGLWLPTANLSTTWIEYLEGCFSLKQGLQEKEQLRNEQSKLKHQVVSCLLHWAEQFRGFSNARGSFEILVRDWEQQKSLLERKAAQHEQTAEQYLRYVDEKQRLVLQLEELQQQLQEVYLRTPFKDEDDFVSENERWELYQQELEKQNQLHEQLSYFFLQGGGSIDDLGMFDSLEEQQLGLRICLEENEQMLEDLQKQLQLVENQIYEIEVGIERFQYQAAYDYRRGILAEEIVEWLVLAQMVDQFQSTMNVFRNEKMPDVLERVSQYFNTLTCGVYERVEICTDIQRFIVQNKDEIRFEVQELSRGTKEQLYTALRFAMAEVSPFQVKIPFIIDDSFVNFDKERLAHVLCVLKDLSADFQVIYFTCNAEVHSSIENLTDVIQPKIS